MSKRLYQLTHKATGAVRLVEADNQAQAFRHVSRDDYTIDIPSPLTLVKLMQDNAVRVEKASDA